MGLSNCFFRLTTLSIHATSFSAAKGSEYTSKADRVNSRQTHRMFSVLKIPPGVLGEQHCTHRMVMSLCSLPLERHSEEELFSSGFVGELHFNGGRPSASSFFAFKQTRLFLMRNAPLTLN